MDATQDTDQAGVGTGARRRRPILASLTTLGVVAGLLGVAGVFAASTDVADTGESDAISGEHDPPGDDVDLQLATATMDWTTRAFTCNDDWSEDLTSGVIVSDGADLANQGQGGGSSDHGYLCIRNAGDAVADVTMTAIELVDTELACSPREGDEDDTCGEGVGELSSHLDTILSVASEGVEDFNCFNVYSSENLAALGSGAEISAPTLDPDEVAGLCPTVSWTPTFGSQTDQATWRYQFAATVSADAPAPCMDDEHEDNDDAESAAAYDGSVEGVACTGDADWFSYEHPGGTLDALVTFSHSDVDIDLYVRDATGTQVGQSISTDDDEQVTLADLPAGTYLILVSPYEGGDAPYTLTVTSPEAP